MKRTVTPSYKAVPFILTVAPNGSTKLVILLEIPHFCSESLIEIGRAAPDEQVEKAVRIAVDIFFMWRNGCSLPMK